MGMYKSYFQIGQFQNRKKNCKRTHVLHGLQKSEECNELRKECDIAPTLALC